MKNNECTINDLEIIRGYVVWCCHDHAFSPENKDQYTPRDKAEQPPHGCKECLEAMRLCL